VNEYCAKMRYEKWLTKFPPVAAGAVAGVEYMVDGVLVTGLCRVGD
jgi:hypothetical protein